MKYLLAIFLGVFIEIWFKPRFDYVAGEQLILWYNKQSERKPIILWRKS